MQDGAEIWHIVHYRPGPNWRVGMPVCDQPLDAHVDFLRDLHGDGHVAMAGPFADSSGGLVVIASDSQTDVESLIADDPAIGEGTLVAMVKPWVRVL